MTMPAASARPVRCSVGSPLARLLAVLLLAFCAPSTPAHAQVRLSGGINLTRFFGDDVGDTDGKRGLDLGASFPLFNMGPFQVRAEGYYRQKGARGVQQISMPVAHEGSAVSTKMARSVTPHFP